MNLQDLLLEMRREQRADHEKLVEKVDTGFTDLRATMATAELKNTQAFGEIDTRLTVVENTRRAFRWALGIVLTAASAGIADLVFNHLPKLFASVK
jgi:hypothetical protein